MELFQDILAFFKLVRLVRVYGAGQKPVYSFNLLTNNLGSFLHYSTHDGNIVNRVVLGLVAVGHVFGIGQNLAAFLPLLHELTSKIVVLVQASGLKKRQKNLIGKCYKKLNTLVHKYVIVCQ